MTLEAALVERVTRTPALHDQLASVGFGQRIDGLPALVFQIVADPRPQHYKGFQRSRPTQVQADIYAETQDKAAALREACITHLVPAAFIDPVQFGRAAIDNVRSGGEPEQSGERQRFRGEIARESIDFTFLHNA